MFIIFFFNFGLVLQLLRGISRDINSITPPLVIDVVFSIACDWRGFCKTKFSVGFNVLEYLQFFSVYIERCLVRTFFSFFFIILHSPPQRSIIVVRTFVPKRDRRRDTWNRTDIKCGCFELSAEWVLSVLCLGGGHTASHKHCWYSTSYPVIRDVGGRWHVNSCVVPRWACAMRFDYLNFVVINLHHPIST